MSWAYVDENDQIQEFYVLPEAWKNISNFYALESDKQTLKSLRWYDLINQSKPISYDLVEYHGAPEYTIDHASGIVYKNCPILQKENLPTPEQTFLQNRNNFMNYLRNRRNELLKQSDWTQTADLQATKSAEWVALWKDYRQALRNLPSLYINPPEDQIVDIGQINWPAPPGI